MDAGLIAALIGGGSIAGVVVDRLITWALSRGTQRVTLADYANQIAERTLTRMEMQLAGAERQMASANATIAELRAEVGQLRTELSARANVTVERDRLLAENAGLKAQIQQLGGTA
ncbi:hypothetical protein ACQEVC_34315 [Plantactinospora sp. CA-294935]|uniref:hypothetical protein n=1 Tax=Plantactinospora sp. CA-294935 TaxID=3240012 RepID=UPI003D8FF1F1